ncbi:hypothetical protein BIW11_01264, partial [Tropilaelaps mercedesae]
MMGEERSVCVEQSPVLSHRASLGGSSSGGLGGLGDGGVMSMARMRPSHSSQDVASISQEQDYWEYGPGIVDRLKSKFINLSMNNQGSSGILRNNKTSPVKKPVANIKPLRKEQPPPEPEMRDSPSPSKFSDNKDNNLSSFPTAFVCTTSSVRGTEVTFNEINLQVNASGGHSLQSHGDLGAGSINASPDIMSISCGSDNRPQSSSTPVTSRQMASNGTQHQLMPSAGIVGPVPEPRTPSLIVKPRACPLLLSESNSRPLAGCPVASAPLGNMGSYAIGSLNSTSCNSMVFDFRGKDVKPQVAVMPSPVKPHLSEELDELDDSSEPSGITFIGENVVIGGGSLISTRNKKLSIRFDEQNLSSFFEYEAEDDDDETDEDVSESFCGSVEKEATRNTARGLPGAALG